MSKTGFSIFLLVCTVFGWGFAAALNAPALAGGALAQFSAASLPDPGH